MVKTWIRPTARHAVTGGEGDARDAQLGYSDIQSAMHDEVGRRTKAKKIISVMEHFLGRSSLHGLTVLDLGSSTGFISDELRLAGARVIGADIDEPGLAAAKGRLPRGVTWLRADGARLPLETATVDLVVFNQIYEHVVDPDGVMAEIRRVLKSNGAAYFGLGNRLTPWEPHVRLPLVSWLPRRLADRVVRATGRGDGYYERFRVRRGLLKMVDDLVLWDYTWSVVAEPERFGAQDMVKGAVGRLPVAVLRTFRAFVPTYIWVGTPGSRVPQGPVLARSPYRLPAIRGAGSASRTGVND